MRFFSIFVALTFFAALAQPPAAHHSSNGSVEDDAIVTIRYNCAPAASGEKGPCAKTVSKHEFEALVRAIDPNMSIDARQSLAAEYSRLLIMAAEARRRGLDQLPELQTLVKFSELQILGARLVRDINASAPPISQEEIANYFRDHQRDYQEVTLSRIFVPDHSSRPNQHESQAAARAEQARTRATRGETFAALQSEIKDASSNTSLGPMHCRSLPEAHRQVCDLQPGEISNILVDKSGYSIYRLESKRLRELDDVRDEIRATLERQHIQGQIQQFRTPASLELNQAYFGKLPESDVASHHGMHFPHAKPVLSSDQTHAHHQH
jgi:bifunctional DNA-binding transcriptional regulator/antitoxin component of YhaV-PrlF toxin-antitoxin module